MPFDMPDPQALTVSQFVQGLNAALEEALQEFKLALFV